MEDFTLPSWKRKNIRFERAPYNLKSAAMFGNMRSTYVSGLCVLSSYLGGGGDSFVLL